MRMCTILIQLYELLSSCLWRLDRKVDNVQGDFSEKSNLLLLYIPHYIIRCFTSWMYLQLLSRKRGAPLLWGSSKSSPPGRCRWSDRHVPPPVAWSWSRLLGSPERPLACLDKKMQELFSRVMFFCFFLNRWMCLILNSTHISNQSQTNQVICRKQPSAIDWNLAYPRNCIW